MYVELLEWREEMRGKGRRVYLGDRLQSLGGRLLLLCPLFRPLQDVLRQKNITFVLQQHIFLNPILEKVRRLRADVFASR